MASCCMLSVVLPVQMMRESSVVRNSRSLAVAIHFCTSLPGHLSMLRITKQQGSCDGLAWSE